jgi:hypothetical protein
MELAEFRCENCKSDEDTLNVHHLTYHKGSELWEYDDHELICYCESCHRRWHLAKESIRKSLTEFRDVNDIYAIAVVLRSMQFFPVSLCGIEAVFSGIRSQETLSPDKYGLSDTKRFIREFCKMLRDWSKNAKA